MEDIEDRAARVLVVDDDDRLQSVVREFLEGFGFEVFSLSSGKGINEEIEKNQPDIVLLDVMMPGADGFTVLRGLRDTSKIPVIMLTAKGDDTDRIIGLEIGADDYIPKPFNPRELVARIKAVLRRAPGPETAAPASSQAESTQSREQEDDPLTIKLGSYTLDARRQKLSRAGQPLELSTTEYRIIHAFMSHPGEVLSRDKVLSLVFGDDHYVCDRNIDVYISRIRGLLRKLGEKNTRIRTVWGAGYSWVPED